MSLKPSTTYNNSSEHWFSSTTYRSTLTSKLHTIVTAQSMSSENYLQL